MLDLEMKSGDILMPFGGELLVDAGPIAELGALACLYNKGSDNDDASGSNDDCFVFTEFSDAAAQIDSVISLN